VVRKREYAPASDLFGNASATVRGFIKRLSASRKASCLLIVSAEHGGEYWGDQTRYTRLARKGSNTSSEPNTVGTPGHESGNAELVHRQSRGDMQILPLYGRCANERCDRSRYGDAPKRGNGRIGSVDTSMPGWLVAHEGGRTFFSGICGPCTLIGVGPKR
jgi:hypothetical protein